MDDWMDGSFDIPHKSIKLSFAGTSEESIAGMLSSRYISP